MNYFELFWLTITENGDIMMIQGVRLMLIKERYDAILHIVNEKKAVSVTELTELLNSSESTIRRDLNALHNMRKLDKVHGGATAIEDENLLGENEIAIKYQMNMNEKIAIAQYAASLIEKDDFVYLDAGTTTEMMVDFITQKDVIYVTNGLSIAKKLSYMQFHTLVIAGKVRGITEAIVGSEAERSLKQYNFTKGFFGTNGITKDGYTTPNTDEALTKAFAMKKCKNCFVLADDSKFEKISSVCFGKLSEATIITTILENHKYDQYTNILEVESDDLHSNI
jgi:Transcriptional regulators of sugar metabolism